MSEFCVKCSEKDAEIEQMRNRHFLESQCMKQRIKEMTEENQRLRYQNDALINDIAFYDGKFPRSQNA
jgi:regulator of replication initiation timing